MHKALVRLVYALLVGIAFACNGGADRTDTSDKATRMVLSGDGQTEVTSVLAGFTLAYIVSRNGTIALIDAGSEVQGTQLLETLSALGHTPSQVQAILLTHGHFDQTAALNMFENATIYIGSADQWLLRGEARPKNLLMNVLSRGMKRRTTPARVREALAAERIRIGELEFDVVPLPGHTEGSLAYAYADLLFTGDSLLIDGESVKPSSWWTSESSARNRYALHRLKDVRFSTVADSRSGFMVNAKARFETWLASDSTQYP